MSSSDWFYSACDVNTSISTISYLCVSLPLPGTRLRVCKNTGHADTHEVILTLLGWHAAPWLPSSGSVFVCMVLSHCSVGTCLRLVRGCFLIAGFWFVYLFFCFLFCFDSVLNVFSLCPSVIQNVNTLMG